LEQFLAKLPQLWREGEARPTHRREAPRPRAWRTRKDPFKGVWPELLLWLQEDPEATVMSLLERLDRKYPGHSPRRGSHRGTEEAFGRLRIRRAGIIRRQPTLVSLRLRCLIEDKAYSRAGEAAPPRRDERRETNRTIPRGPLPTKGVA